MENYLPIVYLSILIALLAIASWVIFRQILRTRRVESTLSNLQIKLNKEKGTAQEYYELGSIYLEKKLYVQAIAQFQKGLKQEETLDAQEAAFLYNALGFAYFAQEQYDLALRNYKEAIKASPNYVVALNNLGHAYERKKLTSQALEMYEQALTYEPNNATAKRRAESLRKRLVPSV